jgi:putative thioredoxin
MTMLQSGEAAAPMGGAVKDTTTQTFVKDVIEESKRQPVLVDFWAEWCGPCKQLAPVLEKVVKAAKGKVKLVKMDIDKHPSIPGQLGIQSIPAVFAFVNGQPVDGFLGALPESQVVAFIERVTKDTIGAEEKDLLKPADEALAKGDAAGAADLYAQVLAQDSGNVAALAGLARSYVITGAIEQAKQTLALVPETKRNDPAVAAARAALEIAEQAKSVGPITELEQKVGANPLDHQARFDLAVALNDKGRRQEAVDNLLDIVKRDRKWNEDGARKQLVQFFEAWGPTDEATVDGRKRLSSVLFA